MLLVGLGLVKEVYSVLLNDCGLKIRTVPSHEQNQVTEDFPLEKINDVHLLISLLGIIAVSTLSTESILRAKP